MSTNNIVPIGCVTKKDIVDTNFISFSDIANVKNLEDCISKAEKYGNLCSENNNENDKCTYVAYKNGDLDDLYNDANNMYDKAQNCNSASEKKKYMNESLQKFLKIWLNYTPNERNNQLDTSSGVGFLENRAGWIENNSNYKKLFIDSKDKPQEPILLKNICWIGGKNVTKNKYVEFVNFDNENNKKESNEDRLSSSNINKNIKCKYGLYNVPGTEGETMSDRILKFRQQQVHEKTKLAEKAIKEANIAKAMYNFTNNKENANLPLLDYLNNARRQKRRAVLQTEIQEPIKKINNKVSNLKEKNEYIDIINKLSNTSRIAINRNIDFVKDKKQIAQKMDSDLQALNWSLEESEKKEILQNKITTTLGIIIMLFAGLCVGLIVYYLIGNNKKLNKIKLNSNKNILNDLFGFNKSGKVTSSNKKAITDLFS